MGGMPLDCSLAESGLKISASRKKKIHVHIQNGKNKKGKEKM